MSVEQIRGRSRLTDPATVDEVLSALLKLRGRLGLLGPEGRLKIQNSADALYRTPVVMRELRARNWGLSEAADVVLEVLDCILVRKKTDQLRDVDRELLCATLNLLGSRDDLTDRQWHFRESSTPMLTHTMYRKVEAGAYYELARLLTRLQSYPCGSLDEGESFARKHVELEAQESLRKGLRLLHLLYPNDAQEKAIKHLNDFFTNGLHMLGRTGPFFEDPVNRIGWLVRLALRGEYDSAVAVEKQLWPNVRLFSAKALERVFLAEYRGYDFFFHKDIRDEVMSALVLDLKEAESRSSSLMALPKTAERYVQTDDFALRFGNSLEILAPLIMQIEMKNEWSRLAALGDEPASSEEREGWGHRSAVEENWTID